MPQVYSFPWAPRPYRNLLTGQGRNHSRAVKIGRKNEKRPGEGRFSVETKPRTYFELSVFFSVVVFVELLAVVFFGAFAFFLLVVVLVVVVLLSVEVLVP
jgi:hypothetical protein